MVEMADGRVVSRAERRRLKQQKPLSILLQADREKARALHRERKNVRKAMKKGSKGRKMERRLKSKEEKTRLAGEAFAQDAEVRMELDEPQRKKKKQRHSKPLPHDASAADGAEETPGGMALDGPIIPASMTTSQLQQMAPTGRRLKTIRKK
eukprot:Hpha_TRINITY_DN16721_c1_g1::TRINITY_DN16721_c1_g1_i1::g.77435::m.77435